MSIEVRTFQATVAAGVTADAPTVTDIAFPPRVVNRVEVVVPPGPNGLLGFRFTSGGLQVIPSNSGAWIIASDERIGWDLTGQMTTGAWQLTAYNTGLYPHTLYLRFLLDLVPGPAPAAQLTLLPLSAISGTVTGLTAGAGPDGPL